MKEEIQKSEAARKAEPMERTQEECAAGENANPGRPPLFTNQMLKKLIVPLIIEQVLAITVGMADTMMISAAGEAAISGVSLVDMINNLLINIFAAIATGGPVVCSQYIGAKDRKAACESAGQLLIITVMISAGIMGLTIGFRRPMLRLFFGSIEEDVMSAAITYLLISALSYPFLALYNSCAALFRSMGNSRISMLTSLLMNIINIIGNAILIFVCDMGVAGAALASMVSRMTAAIILFVLLHNPENTIFLPKSGWLKLNGGMIRRILRIGIPNGLENSIFQLGRVLVVSIIAGFGTVQIAANAVANSMDSMGCIPGQAMNLAVITVVGQCIGAADRQQAIFYTKKLLKFTYAITAVLELIILATLPLTLSIYRVSEETRNLSMILIWIHNGCAILLWPASFTLPNALRAANDVKFTMVISIFSMCAFRLVFSYIIGVGMGLGAIGVWIAMVMDWIFRVTCFGIRFKSGRWLCHSGLKGFAEE